MPNIGLVHVGDVRTDFQLLCQDTDVNGTNSAVDLAQTTTQQIIFTNPDGTESTKTASILNGTGSDGIIRFINTDAAFIDRQGVWEYRAKLTFADGGIFQTNDALFQVLE